MNKRETAFLATALRDTEPRAMDYGPDTVREMQEAVKQWKKMVTAVADLMDRCDETSAAELKKFDREKFIRMCSIDTI